MKTKLNQPVFGAWWSCRQCVSIGLAVVVCLYLALGATWAGGGGDEQAALPQPRAVKNWVLERQSVVRSRDGKRLAYVLISMGRSSRRRVVLDDEPHRAATDVVSLIFSPDSKHFAYLSNSTRGWELIFDGKRHSGFAPTGPLIFSPDSKHVMYIGRNNTQTFVVHDTQRKHKFEIILRDTLTFSPDSKHVAYMAYGRGHWWLVIDDKLVQADKYINRIPVFNKTSTKVVLRRLPTAGR